MSKKVSYISMLKQAIAEFDTSDTVDVKGPMLDPILSWKGDGELPTNKDAASILERYYWEENKDDGVSPLDEADYENDKGQIGNSPSMKDGTGEGTEQAGTSPANTIQGAKKDKEKDITKEDFEQEFDDLLEQDEDMKDEDMKDEEEMEESEDLDLENQIIEKLMAEMEETDSLMEQEEEEEEEEEEDEKEMEEGKDFHGGDVEDAMEEGLDLDAELDAIIAEEKEATSSMEDTKGAGTQQAGTGPADSQVPPRKDKHDQMVKAADVPQDDKISDSIQLALDEIEQSILEQDEDMKDEDMKDEDKGEEKELDVDKKMKEQAPAPSAVPGGPSPKKTGEDWDEDVYEESFKLFTEALEEDVEDLDSDDLRV